MTSVQKREIAYYTGIASFALMLMASFVYPEIWDTTDYEQYKSFLYWYIFTEHVIVLALAKVARMFIEKNWQKITLDAFIAGLIGDLIDRLIGVTDFHVADLYIFGFVFIALSYKHLRKLWNTTKTR